MTSNFQQLAAHFDDLHRTQERSRAAALNGALKAFEKPSTSAATVPVGSPGAFSAANSAAGRFTPRSADRPSPLPLDGNTAATHAFAKYQHATEAGSVRAESPYKQHHDSRRSSALSLAPPPSDDQSRAKSPSNIAAVLATQRFTPRESAPAVAATTPRSWHIDSHLLNQPRRASPHRLDEEEQQPAPGTVGGVATWLESIRDDSPPRRQPARRPSPAVSNKRVRPKTTETNNGVYKSPVEEEMVRVAAPATEIRSPKPVRVPSASKKLRDSSFAFSDISLSSAAPMRPTVPNKPEAVRRMSVAPDAPPDSPADTFTTPPLFPADTPSDAGLTRKKSLVDKPTPPPPRRRNTVKSAQPDKALGLGLSHAKSYDTMMAPPPPPPRRRQVTTSRAPEPLKLSLPVQTHTSLTTTQPARRVSPHMTGESLADAIVASSLASSRVPSPSKSVQERPGLPRRSSERPRTPFSHFKLQQQLTGDSRVSSPGGYTMRKRTSSDEEREVSQSQGPGSRSSRNIFGLRQHPNKHREGDRRRWRGEVGEAERRRYEGVWAANRGLLVEFLADEAAGQTSTSELQAAVAAPVVRDIWSRSRLPAYVLEEVWQLVDRSRRQRLDREEFVVGLWLIDRRLQGAKLPVRVAGSVWASVHGVQGVRVPGFGRRG